MLALELTDFMIELKEGTINNIGGPTKAASAKLFDVESVEVRAFGDNRVKVVCSDEAGNEIEIALFPEHIEAVERDIEQVRASGTVHGMENTG